MSRNGECSQAPAGPERRAGGPGPGLRFGAGLLGRSGAILASILANSSEAVVVLDGQLRILLLNSGAERIFGYDAVELLGEPLDRLIPERFRAAHHNHVERFARCPISSVSMGDRAEVRGLRKDGQGVRGGGVALQTRHGRRRAVHGHPA